MSNDDTARSTYDNLEIIRERVPAHEEDILASLVMDLAGLDAQEVLDPDLATTSRRAALRWLMHRGYLKHTTPDRSVRSRMAKRLRGER